MSTCLPILLTNKFQAVSGAKRVILQHLDQRSWLRIPIIRKASGTGISGQYALHSAKQETYCLPEQLNCEDDIFR